MAFYSLRLALAALAAFVTVSLASSPLLAQAQQAPSPNITQPQPSAPVEQPAAPSTSSPPAAQQPAATPPSAPIPPPAPSVVFPEELAQRVTALAAAIENAEKAVERVKERDDGLAEQRAEAERIETEALSIIAALKPRLDAVRAQVEKLGPAPTGDATDAPAIATERARLNALNSQMAGAVKTAELAQVRSRQLIGRVQDLRQSIFARDLLRRSPSILSGATWRQFGQEMPRAWRQITGIAQNWWTTAQEQAPAIAILMIGAAGAWFLLRGFLTKLVQRRMGAATKPAPFFRRVRSAGVAFLATSLPQAAAAFIVYAGLSAFDLLTYTVGRFADSVMWSFMIYLGISATATALLFPCPPAHRLLNVPPSSAGRLLKLIKCFAAVFAIDLVLRDTMQMLFLPLEIGVLQASVASLVYGVLLIGVVRTPLAMTAATETEPATPYTPTWLNLPLAILTTAIFVTTLLGYVSLGRFISTQVMLVACAAIILLVGHLAARNLATLIAEGKRGHLLEERLGLDHERTSLFSRLLVFMFDVGLLLAAVPLLLLTWGFASQDIFDWLKLGMFGFEIGQFRISIARILIAAALFLTLVSITRIIQRWLDKSVLQPARVDSAISHSVLMGIGYAGIGLAALAGLSYAGLDFTHLAIVAGALSVGIGFGLQAIFNNFVSGLILLIERPIKVGDWIIVNGKEGFVRRINVRATEIETFDRASVIIPNSQLITGDVTNLTHRNAMGRVLIKVGVSYKADPAQVMRILQEVADKNTTILKMPAPGVGFDDFGADALMFSLVAFVADVSRRGAAQTELRMAINKAFAEAGIEMPFAQRDIHLRDLDGVRKVLTAAMEARQREKEMQAKTVDEPQR